MHVLFMLSVVDSRLWLKFLQPEFEDLFFAMAIENARDVAREASWTSMGELFYRSLKMAPVVNGNNEPDAENNMDVDHSPLGRGITSFLWQVTINCLKRATGHIPLAGKAFDTAAIMFRCVSI
jgi:hypothetical protein